MSTEFQPPSAVKPLVLGLHSDMPSKRAVSFNDVLLHNTPHAFATYTHPHASSDDIAEGSKAMELWLWCPITVSLLRGAPSATGGSVFVSIAFRTELPHTEYAVAET
jgi:hypothetical protein